MPTVWQLSVARGVTANGKLTSWFKEARLVLDGMTVAAVLDCLVSGDGGGNRGIIMDPD